MLSIKHINSHLDNYDFDVRKTGDARWIDQKCTPDVVCIVADCIINFVNKNGINTWFTSKDIWHSDYTEKYVEAIFNKPNTKSKKSVNEYNKFFSMPLKMLASAKILEVKKERANYFKVNERKLLEFISMKEFFTLQFMIEYINKVLKDSGLTMSFNDFFEKQNKANYDKLKNSFMEYVIKYTGVKKKKEPNRMFPKILNPLAYHNKKKGTYDGRISKNDITYSSLMYNKENFRDKYSKKPKNLTRKEWEVIYKSQVNENYYKYQSVKARDILRRHNDAFRGGVSEVRDEYNVGRATHIHHIFPQITHPEISMYYENLIALTPTQHLNKAHPMNHTSTIDKDYQELLLRAKAGTIDDDIIDNNENTIYSFENFIKIINIGFEENYEINKFDYIYVMELLNYHYNDKR